MPYQVDALLRNSYFPSAPTLRYNVDAMLEDRFVFPAGAPPTFQAAWATVLVPVTPVGVGVRVA
jgi:hypothetical protein